MVPGEYRAALYRDDANETKRCVGYIFEAVLITRLNEQGIAGIDHCFLGAITENCVAFNNEYFVLGVLVAVYGDRAARFDLKQTHCIMRGTVFCCDQPA